MITLELTEQELEVLKDVFAVAANSKNWSNTYSAIIKAMLIRLENHE